MRALLSRRAKRDKWGRLVKQTGIAAQ